MCDCQQESECADGQSFALDYRPLDSMLEGTLNSWDCYKRSLCWMLRDLIRLEYLNRFCSTWVVAHSPLSHDLASEDFSMMAIWLFSTSAKVHLAWRGLYMVSDSTHYHCRLRLCLKFTSSQRWDQSKHCGSLAQPCYVVFYCSLESNSNQSCYC